MAEGCESIKPQLSDYLDHLLTAPEMGAIEHHLADCPECFAHLAELRHVQTALQNLPAVEPPEAFYHRVLDKIQGVDTVPLRPPWFSMVSYKAAGTFAILALVLIATREKRKSYLHIQQSADTWSTPKPASVMAPMVLHKEITTPAKAAPPAVPPPKTKTAPVDQLTSLDSRRDEKSSLYSTLQQQYFGGKSANLKRAPSPIKNQVTNAPIPVVASNPAPVTIPAVTASAPAAPIATHRTVLHQQIASASPSHVGSTGNASVPSTPSAPVAKPAPAETQDVEKDETAAAIPVKNTPEETATGSAPAEEASPSAEAEPPEATKKVLSAPTTKGFHDAQLKGQAPTGWTVNVVRNQQQLDKLIASLPDSQNGDLKEIGTQFDSDMLLVLVPRNAEGQSPVIENQVPDVFTDRVDLYYLELPPSQNNPPVVTCITVPKTQLPIIFKRVSVAQ